MTAPRVVRTARGTAPGLNHPDGRKRSRSGGTNNPGGKDSIGPASRNQSARSDVWNSVRDQAVQEVVRDPDLPCIVSREPSEASMAWYSEKMVAMVKHWTMEKAAGTSDALTNVQS
ncbi:hypothetical protein R1flu_020870 [Riccia fluitans]|uniref:Uncharacterized protein n=1 Tax=Riccia fluitans TaxID=41844 RepID=A0ABD1ZMR3_9MARC